MKIPLQIVAYVVIPAMLVSMWFLVFILLSRSRGGARYSAYAGAASGVVLFALYFVSTFQGTRASTTSALAEPQNAPIYVWAIGIVVGFAALFLVHRMGPRNTLLGSATFFLTATSCIALLAYFYSSPHRDEAVSFTLGSLLGILLYGIPFGEQIGKIFRRADRIDMEA